MLNRFCLVFGTACQKQGNVTRELQWKMTRTYLNSLQHRCLAYIDISRIYGANRFRPTLLCSPYCFPKDTFASTTCVTETTAESANVTTMTNYRRTTSYTPERMKKPNDPVPFVVIPRSFTAASWPYAGAIHLLPVFIIGRNAGRRLGPFG